MRFRFALGSCCAGVLFFLAANAQAQVPPDQAADMLLGAARKAYNERNYPFAADKFREFLQKFGGHAHAPAARYGLALTLLDMPERKYAEAAEQLQALASNKALPEYPLVQYHLGLCRRAIGLAELAQAVAKPNEAQPRRDAAKQRFAEAERHFAEAAAAFWAKVKLDPNAKDLPLELEWHARSLCDQAEMLLRLTKAKEARDATLGFVQDPSLSKSRYLRLGLYYHGYGSFLLKDIPAAARTLNRKDLFDDPAFGTHARYLVARIHHLDGEASEAATQYDAVVADYNKQKAQAIEALKRPDQFRDNPEERARLEALVKSPPDHVLSALFDSATLLYDGGKYGEALARLGDLVKQFPNAPRLPEALLHTGFCQVQLKQYPEAIQTLTPLVQKNANLADQALLWIGKAQAQAFDPNNPQARTAALGTAIKTLQQAAERASQLAGSDPDAKIRRADILLELADTMQSAGQSREAAGIYEQLQSEKLLPQRAEEIGQRIAAAWHLAGDYARSDQACAKFMTDFPQSPLRAAVTYRQAENAYFTALAASKKPDLPNRAQELPKLFDEAIKRYQLVIDKFPEFERIHLARYSLATSHIQKGDYEKARTALEAIPVPDRTGDLALAPYLLADCLIRLAPANAEDAAAAGKLLEQLQSAAALLDSFAGGNPQAAEAPDALLKFGYCQQKLAQLLAQPQEKAAAIQAARTAYDKFTQQYGKDPRVPQAVFERAKVKLLANDIGGAQNDLRQFLNGPYQDATIAPMAVIRLATLHRQQNQAAEAAKVLDECRKKHEAALNNDKARSGWAAPLRYHHGVALVETGKLAEARGLFDQVAQPAGEKSVAGEAALRGGQCRLQEARLRIEAARQKLAAAKPEGRAAVQKELDDAWNGMREAGKYLEQQAEAFKTALPTAEARARMYYDAAWAYRAVADSEIVAVRDRMQQDQHKKLIDEATKKLPPGAKLPPMPMPEVARASIPVQPAEDKARNLYRSLIGAFADVPLANEARFELAEMYADRGEFDPAVAVLREGIDKEPPQELTDRLRLRLGACLLAKKDAKGALAQFDLITDPKSPSWPQAVYRSGEALIDLADYTKAVARLVGFRDRPELQNIPGLTDRALLRLGVALALAKQWDSARQAYEVLAQRFGNSPWLNEARYGMGWARQNLKQFDEAVNAYQQVVNSTTNELAAKAQLQIGLCRLEQKRFAEAAAALLVVPHTFDFAELNAAALCEAARSYIELKNREQAERLLQRVLRDYAESEWAKVAKERLEALKKS